MVVFVYKQDEVRLKGLKIFLFHPIEGGMKQIQKYATHE